MRFFTCILLLSLALIASAQKVPRQHKRLPFFLALNPERLSQRLTRNLDSDSAKVQAIHSWITYNIKYDVKKWQRFDYTRIPVKKILRRRKAICVGYSDLFSELCRNAGLQSVPVPGYTKNMNVDIMDNFFVDDHMWNAVLVNGMWKLVDVTWDAGYITYHRKTFLGQIVYIGTVGRVVYVKYKPKFTRYPVDMYCLRNGEFFKTDHLPLDPIWQLADTTITIEEFKKDSAYYFKRYDPDVASAGINSGPSAERSEYFRNNPGERLKADGIAGNRFNWRNEYCIGNTWSIRVKEIMKDIDPKSKDTIAQLRICDTIISRADSGLAHYDSNAVLLQVQKEELLANSSRKKEIFSRNHKRLLNSSKGVIRKLNRGKSASYNTFRFCVSLMISNRNKSSSLKDRSFYKITRVEPDNEKRKSDSLLLARAIKAISDSLAFQEKKVDKHFAGLDSLYFMVLKRHSDYSRGVRTSRRLLSIIYEVRLAYYDDHDHEVRWFADTLINRKLLTDTLLYINGEYVLDHAFEKLKRSKMEIAKQFQFYKTKMQLMKKYKAVCGSTQEMDDQYRAVLDSLDSEVNRWNSELSGWAGRLSGLWWYCKIQKWHTRGEVKDLLRERRIEYNMYHVRGSYIRKRSGSLMKMNNRQRKILLLQKREAERQKQKLMQKKR